MNASDLNPLGAIFDIGAKVIDRVLPDPAQKAQAQLALLQLHQSGELTKIENDTKLALAQIEVNKVEASMTGFKGAWRPCVGYVCVIGLFYSFIIQPLASWLSGIWHWPPPPALDISTLITLLFGMLGLGTMRTLEKTQEKD